ncbi:MAG: amino acid ABC transporter permease [Chloroflexi bacterium]|nr:amino acid ABC transporter permease [Chloroflexota bacterium]MCC6895328.1 amino acid ABC transporter permease [Anaerolineae bacterium]
MTTFNEQHPAHIGTTVINEAENVERQPPLLAVGPLAWIKKNLFNTVWDGLLTIIVLLIVSSVLVSFVTWTVGQANWYTITFNIRLLMLGRYEPEYEWRVTLVVLLFAFTIGLALAAWSRIGRGFATFIAVIIALTFILPVVINATLPLPPYYASAGTFKIGGDNGQAPQGQIGFTGKAGETVTVQLADQYDGSDAELAQVHSFADAAVNTALNAAANRLIAERRVAELTALLATDTLTPNQRSRAEGELSRLTVPPPVTETLMLNQVPVTVSILHGTTMEPLENGVVTFEDADALLTVTLPEDGWYVLKKELDDPQAISILETTGIYPILERNVTRGGDDSTPATGSISQYVRMTDTFTTEATRPLNEEGKELPFIVVTSNQYRGTAVLNDYLRLYVAPFLNQIKVFLAFVFVVGAVGYIAGRALDRRFSPSNRPHATTSRLVLWLLIVLPVISFILIYGLTGDSGFLPLTDTRRWGGVLLTMLLTIVGIIGSLPLGVLLALGRRSKYPVISTVCVIYIELVRGIPFITVLFMAQLLIPLINPALANFPGAFRAMIATVLFTAAYNAEVVRGGLQAIPHGQDEAAKALGLNGLQVTLFITLPQALRLVIPPMMGNFVGMFKDTSLVAIVGLLDLTGMAQNIVSQTEFLGLRRETFMFISIFYFVFSYVIAAVSRRIESTGAGQAIKTQI